MIWRVARLQQLCNVALRPVSDPRWRDVGIEAGADRILPARKARLVLDAAEQIARRVAFVTMPECLHQIATAIPLRVMRRVGLDLARPEVEQLPEADESADLEQQIGPVWWGASMYRRQRAQIGHQVGNVADARMRIARIGKHRVIV